VNHLISFVDLTTCNSEDYKCSDEGHNYEKKNRNATFLAEGKTFCFVFFCVKWMQTLTYIYAHTSISTSEKKLGPQIVSPTIERITPLNFVINPQTHEHQ
jgi:hypothetical protein